MLGFGEILNPTTVSPTYLNAYVHYIEGLLMMLRSHTLMHA